MDTSLPEEFLRPYTIDMTYTHKDLLRKSVPAISEAFFVTCCTNHRRKCICFKLDILHLGNWPRKY